MNSQKIFVEKKCQIHYFPLKCSIVVQIIIKWKYLSKVTVPQSFTQLQSLNKCTYLLSTTGHNYFIVT